MICKIQHGFSIDSDCSHTCACLNPAVGGYGGGGRGAGTGGLVPGGVGTGSLGYGGLPAGMMLDLWPTNRP